MMMTYSFLLSMIVQLLVVIGVFAVMVYIGKFLFRRIKSTSHFKSSKVFNLQKYLPEEEVVSLRQVFYLVMIIVFVVILLYLTFDWKDNSLSLLFLNIAVSLYLAIHVDRSSFKNKFLLFSLIPFGSLGYLIFASMWMPLFDFFHIIAYLYFIKQYYQKFIDYTETNSLGITIMLLFLIVFISFLFTILVEGVSPLDSINMVSNAFTSNGYTVLGSSTVGKLNAIFLVWSGFVLSGVGTATLSVAIVMKYANEKFDHLEELVKKNNKK